MSLSNILNLTKSNSHDNLGENSEKEFAICELEDKITRLESELSKLDGKYQWEVNKKEALEKELHERLEMMDEMQSEIRDLRDVLRNPFERMEHDDSDMELEYVD